MAWALAVAAVVALALVLTVALLVVLVLRLRVRLSELESRASSSDADVLPQTDLDSTLASLDAPAQPEFVITRVGEPEVEAPVARVDATLFTDLLLKESAVQAASLAHGLRRALAPETRHRIRFHVRQEVKRSRKQRRAELRDVRREWAARQRTRMAAQDPAA